MMKPGGQLGAEGELPRTDRTGPDHDLIKQGGEHAAVNDAGKAAMLRLGHKLGAHATAIGVETQSQAEWVGLAADVAGAGVG